MLNILYIGPNNSEWAQYNRPVDLAAAKWSRGFLTALSKLCKLTVLTHSHERTWPLGDVFWRGYDSRLFPAEWDCVAVSYPSVYKIREIWLRYAYPNAVKEIVRAKQIDVAILYNCYMPYMLSTMQVLHSMGVCCIPIILDGDDPRKDDWGWIKQAAKYADAFVPLSWWIHKRINENTGKTSYHFDGGAENWKGVPPKSGMEKKEKVLVHTGALDEWRGLDFMIGVVEKLTSLRKDVSFVFCGKSSAGVLKRVFDDNPLVELPGLVSEDKMGRLCNSADVLLNVRNPAHPDNILNYPSKLPHYLSFGRPIVSTRLESLSPEYESVVEFSRDDTVTGFVSKVEEVLAWSDDMRELRYKSTNKWFENNKKWDTSVSKLYEWMCSVVKKN